MNCFCDSTPPSAYWAPRPLARTAHRCDECSRTIQPGERYERVRGVWEGLAQTFHTCVYCLGVRDTIEARAECFCWEHGNMLEQAIEWVREDDTPGLKMAVGRWIVEGQRDRVPKQPLSINPQP